MKLLKTPAEPVKKCINDDIYLLFWRLFGIVSSVYAMCIVQ
jgi:hypothetical protein